jgi:2,4-dienoyl-CoA reductase (NADPH2)
LKLLSPISIGAMQVKNRMVMSPMTTNYGNEDQTPSDRLIKFLEARAKGGVGLITVEVCTVDVKQKYQPQSMTLGDDSFIASHRRLTDALHAHNVKIQPQITHPGPESLIWLYHGEQSVGPSICLGASTSVASRALAIEELDGIVEQYAQAARRAREAGYDAMELHAAHGYMLLGTFLSPVRNIRDDEYGAQNIENRTRLLVRVLRRIKEVAGRDFPITLRISGFERLAGGRASYDTARIAPILVEAGVDAFHVSGGVSDRTVSQIVCSPAYPDGYNVPQAEAIRRAVDVPVMVVGRIHDPDQAEEILRQEKAGMIVFARPLLADPELPLKIMTGRTRDIRRCISCQNCIDSMFLWPTESKMACAVNAASGRELELTYARAKSPKRIVIVGGGPGGMETARVATLRGHKVTLLEKRRRLGGSLTLAATVHGDNGRFLDFLLRQMESLAIDIRLGVAADVQAVKALAPDEVVVATGAALSLPPIPGIDLPHVITGADLRRLVNGESVDDVAAFPSWMKFAAAQAASLIDRHVTPARLRTAADLWLPIGQRVAIVGGDLAAIELAEFLAKRGRDVCILAGETDIAPEIGPKRRLEHEFRLERLKVSINTGVEVDRITREGVNLRMPSCKITHVRADTVIVTGEPVAETSLHQALSAQGLSSHAIGDCTGLGLIVKATYEGAELANRL